MVIHIVEAGETVYSIAQEYGVPVSQIVAGAGRSIGHSNPRTSTYCRAR